MRRFSAALLAILVLAGCDDDPAGAAPAFEGRWSLYNLAGLDVPLLLLSAPASQVPAELPPECTGPEDSVDVWLDGATLELHAAGDADVDVRTRYALGCLPPGVLIGDVLTTTGSWSEHGDEIALELGDSIPLSEGVWISPQGATTGHLLAGDTLRVRIDSGLITLVLEFEREP